MTLFNVTKRAGLVFSILSSLLVSSCNWTGESTSSSITEIQSFCVDNIYCGTIVGPYIAVEVPSGTDRTAMIPTISHTGSSVSPASGVAQNFTVPVIYTLEAANSLSRLAPTLQNYTVVVAETANTDPVVEPTAPSSNKDIIVFAINGSLCTAVDTQISCSVAYDADITSLTPTVIVSSSATVSPASGVSQNFTNPVSYTVTAEDLSTKVYTVTVNLGEAPVAIPEISPDSGIFLEDFSVSIRSETAGASIYYTTNGDDPVVGEEGTTLYTVPISVTGDGTFMDIKAIAVKEGMTDSSVTSKSYTLLYNEVSAAPTISPASGSYFSAFSVTITSAIPSADIYYTTDGTDPTTESTFYEGPIAVSGNTAMTLKAKAFYSSHNITSSVATTSYTLFVAGAQTTFSVGNVNFIMVGVPGGLTCPTGVADNGSATVASAYQIGETEVTYNLWYAVRAWGTAHGYTFGHLGVEGRYGASNAPTTTGLPVTGISWRDVMVWTNALTEYYNAANGTSYTCAYYTDAGYTTPIRVSTTSTTTTYGTPGSQDNPYVKTAATGFRLPKNSEWELAARYKNGALWTPGNYASGSTAPDTDAAATGLVAWNGATAGSNTHVVKGKLPNALGLYDMSGNVTEFIFENSGVRGGSWFDTNTTATVQVGNIYGGYPGYRFPIYSPYDSMYDPSRTVGFRIAKTVP